MGKLRNIPSVNELLENPSLRNMVDKVSHNVVVNEVRSFLDNLRNDIKQTASDMAVPTPNELADRIAHWISRRQQPLLRPVINATGILLHTGLGRAPLPRAALDEIHALAGGYASVEVDLESGDRSQRVQCVRKLLRQLTGAEDVAVVNNNAGATLLALAALATGKEVIVSRGQLIEIGGSYRLPDVMETSGAVLREVGTTNKTRIADYESAISDSTAALMRVHSSNYKIVGFTQQVSINELVQLGKHHHLPVIDDVGSGALVDFSKYGLGDEPIVPDCVKAGADLVLFSGDKMLGGPQCGIIVGRGDLIRQITKHPLMRAFRVDKLTLAALSATLGLYLNPDKAEQEIPLLSLLSTSAENLKNRAERIAGQLAASEAIKSVEAREDSSYLGGGSVPTQQLPTWGVAIAPSQCSVDDFARSLRTGKPSVFGRIQRERLFLDLRSVPPCLDEELCKAVSVCEVEDA